MLVDLRVGHGTFGAPQGPPPKRLEPFVFYKMTKRDEVQFGASSKRFRLGRGLERRRRKAERLAGRMASAPDDERERTIVLRSLAYEADEADVRKNVFPPHPRRRRYPRKGQRTVVLPSKMT